MERGDAGGGLTREAAGRDAMVRAQVRREAEREGMDREGFLRSLELRVKLHRMAGGGDVYLPRALELLNRTNQFNTTGDRWTDGELRAWADAPDHAVWVWATSDRFTDYGVTGVALVDGEGGIRQLVMSCRTIGLEVEMAVLAHLRPAHAVWRDSGANGVSRDVFARAGFSTDGGERWDGPPAPPPAPAHAQLLLRDDL